MKTNKLTFAAMLVSALAWSGVAQAQDPCGVPGEILKACEIVEEPECHDVCEPDAMLISCLHDAAGECMDQCETTKSIECEAGCTGACQAECSHKFMGGGHEECEIECGADCMGGCSAWCEHSKDKTTCFAGCNQQCSAHCTVSCLDGDYSCEVECAQACTGTCKAEIARDCEMACQAEAVEECKEHLDEKCHEVCDEGGVLACDEQYVDIDDINACMAELERLGTEVRGPIAALKGGSEVTLNPRAASCSVEDQAKLGLAGALFTVLSFGLGATFLRRRRS